jgi:hypothetical protein
VSSVLTRSEPVFPSLHYWGIILIVGILAGLARYLYAQDLQLLNIFLALMSGSAAELFKQTRKERQPQ